VERTITLSAIIGILFLGISLIRGFATLMEPRPILANVESQVAAADLHPELLAANLGGEGYWLVAGWKWTAGIATKAADEIDRHLADVADRALRTSPHVSGDEPIHSVVRLVKQAGFPFRTVEGGRVYEQRQSPFRLQIVVRDQDDSESPASLVFALQQESSDNWTVFDLSPAEARSGASTDGFPLPANAVEVARRVHPDGQLALALIDATQADAALPESWEAGGWTMHETQDDAGNKRLWVGQKGNQELALLPLGDTSRTTIWIIVPTR